MLETDSTQAGNLSAPLVPQAPWWSRRNSVRNRILLLLVVAFIPGLLMETWIYWQRFEVRRNEECRNNIEMARAVAKTFESFLDDLFDQEKLIGVLATAHLHREVMLLTQAIKAVQRSHPEVREIRWITPDGAIAVDSENDSPVRNVADQPYFQAISSGKEQYVGDLYLSRTLHLPLFVVALGTRDRDCRLLGVVAAHVDPAILAKSLAVRRFERGSYAIIDRNGMLVYRCPPLGLSWEERNWLQAYPEIGEALHGREATAIRPSRYDEAERVLAVTPIPTIGWVASAARPVAEIVTPIIISLGRQAGLVLLVVIIALLVALGIARSITRPLEKLRFKAVGLGSGSRNGRIEVKGPAELQELTIAFNGMSREIVQREEELKETKNLLEKRVRERTAELAAATETLRRYAEELEIRNKDLEDFAFLTAHDLQEPLRKIQVFSSLLQTKYGPLLEPSGSDHLDRMQNAAKKMQDLIKALHYFFVVTQRGRPATPVDLNALIKEMLPVFQSRADWKTAQIAIGSLPTVEADQIQMGELFFQLIDNGVKFSRPGIPPEIKIYAELPGEGAELSHRIVVEDNGIGFDEKYAERIFMPLEKIHADPDYHGTGIGLALCKKIVEYHRGTISARSVPGQGSKFIVTLPAKARLVSKPPPLAKSPII